MRTRAMADPLPRPRPKRGRHRAQDADRHVGARVRARRVALGLDQQELARRVGITSPRTHKYATGALRIAVGLLFALAVFRLLDVVKPGPIGWADRQGGAAGVMADDLIAGALAALAAFGAQETTAPGVTRFIRFRKNGTVSYGILDGSAVEVLRGDLFGPNRRTGTRYRLQDLELLAPCAPSKVLAVGLNYQTHLGDRKPSPNPEIFYKPITCLQHPGAPIAIPPDAKNVHYEGELVIVIGLSGLSLALRGTWVIWRSVAWPATSWPKIVYLKSRNRGWPVVMKNCEPFVLGPELASASWPEPSKTSCGLNWSWNGKPGWLTVPVAVLLLEPPWTMWPDRVFSTAARMMAFRSTPWCCRRRRVMGWKKPATGDSCSSSGPTSRISIPTSSSPPMP